MVTLKRAYEAAAPSDGARVLVERLWPRGVKKDSAKIYWWPKELAPSSELRKWFHAHPGMWRQFRDKYLKELRKIEAESALEQLYELVAAHKRVTLVFGSRDTEHNSAVVLKELLEGMRKPPSSSGPERSVLPTRMRARKT